MLSGILGIIPQHDSGDDKAVVPLYCVVGVLSTESAQIRTREQCIGIIESKLGRSLTQEEIDDYSSISDYIALGATSEARGARIMRIHTALTMVEMNLGLNESEVRSLIGVQ